ncbi:hypothetical protein RHSIM_RhsimUnG0129100 [Rhododendron simsii]|uniref:HAT C-terminal dimerisation domain-containing protein n=1 Tax=Rhododendron simsii TaxID=118357 RepID=A0A834L4P1_RHOSS|nr:hypothetical protein RHSIM_RhsimUnG0129100 [Rhododendron simsii]
MIDLSQPTLKWARSEQQLFTGYVLRSSIVKVRDSVAYWTATQNREEAFEGATRQLGITYGKNLSLDCPTRWNSTFLMLQTTIKYRNAFGRLKLKDPQYKSCPNDDDWNLAEDIYVCDIKVRWLEWVCCGIDVVEEMALNMLEKYDKYRDNTHEFLAVAVVLDPRDVLAMPMSTVASECSFSTSGRVVSPSRNRLHPKTLEALTCTQTWLAALENEEVPTINDEDTNVDGCTSDVTTVDD